MSDEVLFKSAADALRFAFNYSHQQYDRPLMNRMMGGEGGSGKGLSGQDGAGQAGMVHRRIQGLSNLHRAVLALRFLPRSFPCACGSACCSRRRRSFDWEEAASAVGAYAVEAIPGGGNRYRLRTELVRRFYGADEKLAAIAEETGVSLRTVEREASAIAGWLRGTKATKTKAGTPGVDVLALAAAEELLAEAGLFE